MKACTIFAFILHTLDCHHLSHSVNKVLNRKIFMDVRLLKVDELKVFFRPRPTNEKCEDQSFPTRQCNH